MYQRMASQLYTYLLLRQGPCDYSSRYVRESNDVCYYCQ
jgi:hypothetical protein